MIAFNKNILLFVVVLFYASQVNCKFSIKKLFHHDATENKNEPATPHKLKFNFENCGPASDIFIVDSLMVTPDPIKLPGNINLNGEVNIKSNITAPLQMTLKIIRKIGPIKFEIPCVDNFGSCSYTDVCSMLPTPENCPDYFIQHQIPCNCPFAMGDYSAKNVLIEIDIPNVIPPGEYEVLANFQSKQNHVGCVEIFLNVA